MHHSKKISLSVIGLSLIILLPGCTQNPSSRPPSVGLARIDGNTVALDVARDDGFAVSEQIWMNETSRRIQRVGIDPVTKLGYQYSAERNVNVQGTGTLSTFVECTVNRMSGRQTCLLFIGPIGQFIEMTRQGRAQRICAIGHDFPGRTAQFRVDRNTAIRTGTDGCLSGVSAERLLAQIRRGTTLLVQNVAWPYDVANLREYKVGSNVDVAVRVWQFANSPKLTAALFKVDESSEHKNEIVRRYTKQ